MFAPYFITPPVIKHEERVALLNKCNQLRSKRIRDIPGVNKNLSCHTVDIEDVMEDVKELFIVTDEANGEFFGFKLFDNPPLSVNINSYSVGHEYGWHMDGEIYGVMRDIKLTTILNLSVEPYTGGEFELNACGINRVIEEFMPGCILVFPSFLLHRVSPVKTGQRHSLSIWFKGPNWK